MGKERLAAFSDGVIAIIITIMVLELVPPHGAELTDLLPLWPVFLSYVLSFAYVGAYWNNHHHLFQAVKVINGKTLWVNLLLLLCLSLIPFVTGWVGENEFARWPVVVYGLVLLLSGVAYTLLVRTLLPLQGRNSLLAQAIGRDWKDNISLIVYIVGVVAAFINPWLGIACYFGLAVIWLIPDRRIEARLRQQPEVAD